LLATCGARRLALALALTAATTALGEESAARGQASTHFRAGVRQFEGGDAAAALVEFRAAYNAMPSYEVLYNIALCERALSRYGEALADFQRYLREGGTRVPGDRRAAVADEIAQILARTAEVDVAVAGAPATVSVDGEQVGVTPLPPLVLGPGRKTF